MNQKKKTKFGNKTFASINIPEKEKNFPIDSDTIKILQQRSNEKITFSFRFLDLETEPFNLGGVCEKRYPELFQMLSNVSSYTRHDLTLGRSTYRCHPHDWDKLDYKFNFDDDFLEQVDCRQIRIGKSKGGIHGFLVGSTFYIVWIDRHHNLYPDDRYGGLKILKPPQTCCSFRDEELENLHKCNEDLLKENNDLMELLDNYTS